MSEEDVMTTEDLVGPAREEEPEAPASEQAVTVPEGSNRIVVHARDHGWVAVTRNGTTLVTELSGSPQAAFVVAPGEYVVTSDGKISDVAVDAVELAEAPLAGGEEPLMLRLESDAPDRHVVDGIGEVPADGSSFCTITVEKVDVAGEAKTGKRDTDEVFLRATGGRIEDAKGKGRIRSLKLKGGRASFRLVADEQPRLVTVTAFGHGSPEPAELRIELV
jgi:hypothetical protein